MKPETKLNMDGAALAVHIPWLTPSLTESILGFKYTVTAEDEWPTRTPLCKNAFIWISRPEMAILCSENPLNYPQETETKLHVDGAEGQLGEFGTNWLVAWVGIETRPTTLKYNAQPDSSRCLL